MSDFIVVTGESQYQENPVKVVLNIDVSVRAANEDVASQDMQSIVHHLLDHLFEAGLTKEEVTFGGRETLAPWWKRDKPGLLSRNRITIQSKRRALVYETLEKMERYKNDKRVLVEVDERQPVFVADPQRIQQAMEEACANAFHKASILAEACKRKVGEAIFIKEIFRGVRGSGSFGDYDYGDYQGMAVAAGPIASPGGYQGDPAARIGGNQRVVYVKYRIKYQLI